VDSGELGHFTCRRLCAFSLFSPPLYGEVPASSSCLLQRAWLFLMPWCSWRAENLPASAAPSASYISPVSARINSGRHLHSGAAALSRRKTCGKRVPLYFSRVLFCWLLSWRRGVAARRSPYDLLAPSTLLHLLWRRSRKRVLYDKRSLWLLKAMLCHNSVFMWRSLTCIVFSAASLLSYGKRRKKGSSHNICMVRLMCILLLSIQKTSTL